MAKVEVNENGIIQSISGRLGNFVYKHYKDGSVRVYLAQPKQKRTTPLSEKEIAQRIRFRQATTYYTNLSDVAKQEWYEAWQQDHMSYKGKPYSFKGYVVARKMAMDTELSLG